MRKLGLFFLIFISIVSCNGQQLNKTEFDEAAGDNILIGQINLDGLKSAPYSGWFNLEYNDYQVDDASLATVDKDVFIDEIKIVLVFGTWCSDSRREVPRFYKILNNLAYDLNNMKVICVNTNKTAEGEGVESIDIQRVPTFIFYRQGVEIGRIIETPNVSLEKDLVKIIRD
jgi:thiol-disulfide isomerase/thioredoxin